MDQHGGQFEGGHIPDPYCVRHQVTFRRQVVGSVAPFHLGHPSGWSLDAYDFELRILESLVILLWHSGYLDHLGFLIRAWLKLLGLMADVLV